MIVSLVRTIAASICLSVLGMAAHAQSVSPPQPLSPQPLNPPSQLELGRPAPANDAATRAPVQLPTASAPTRLVPAARPAPTSNQDQPSVPGSVRVRTGIEIDGLTKIDAESMGALSTSKGGLGDEIWRGVRRDEAVDLIRRMPVRHASPALRDLTSRLLLTRTRAPVATSEDAPSMVAERTAALLANGDMNGTELMLAVAPTQSRPADLDLVDAHLQVLKFDNARACGLARKNLSQATHDFWQRLLIYCDAIEGRAESAALGLSLLRETSGDDPALALLLDSIVSGERIELDAIENPRVIHLAMSRAASATLPLDIANTDNALVLYGATMAPNLSLGGRIEAAERSAQRGIIHPDDLRELYTQVTFSESDVANALTRAQEIGGSAARALLYQAASKINIPVARAEIITSAFDVAREDDRYVATAMAFKPLMDRLPPSPEMGWFALTGLRAYLTLGEPVGAERWLALLRATASVRPETQIALARVRPLAWVLGVKDASTTIETMLDEWQDSLAGQPELGAFRHFLNGMLLALDEDVPPSAWTGIEEGASQIQPMPLPATWYRFKISMRDFLDDGSVATPRIASASLGVAPVAGTSTLDRSGSGIKPGVAKPLIYTLMTMGSGGPETRSAITTFEGVSALNRMGFVSAARKLAVESLLAAGL